MDETSTKNPLEEELKDFLYIITHDLKNPVRGIKQASDWLIQDYSDKLEEEGLQMLAMLSEKSNLLSNMIDALHNYSKISITNNKLELVNLEDIIDAIAEKTSKKITKIDINQELIVIKHLQKNTELLTDYKKFVQTIQEIFLFLIKCSPKNIEKVKIEMRYSKEKENKSKLIIKCETAFVDPMRIPKLFSPFQELIIGTTKINTMMGLTLSKKVIESLEGNIEVRADQNSGVEFIIVV